MDEGITLKKIDALRRMRVIFEDKSKWCKGVSAKDANGVVTYSSGETAVQWSLGGAVCFVSGTDYRAIFKYGRLLNPVPEFSINLGVRLFKELDKTLSMNTANGHIGTNGFNDDPKTTMADVNRVIDDTIARLEASQR